MGTYGALYKCFKKDNIENGLASRMMICTMPDNWFSSITTYAEIPDESAQIIEDAVKLLRSLVGHLYSEMLNQSVNQWLEEKRIEALRAFDKTKDTFRKCAAVIAFRSAVTYSLLKGQDPDPDTCLFFKAMADLQLDMQIECLGVDIENIEPRSSFGTNNADLLSVLPGKFDINDIAAIRRDTSRSTLKSIIFRWKKNLIKKIDTKYYKKI